MTRERFIKILEDKRYSYKIEGDKIVVTEGDASAGDVLIFSLETIPPGVVFENIGDVGFPVLTTISPGVEFKNGGEVTLSVLETIPPGVEFKNGKGVYIYYIIGINFLNWEGNIDGIDSKRLLNLMIKQEMFI